VKEDFSKIPSIASKQKRDRRSLVNRCGLIVLVAFVFPAQCAWADELVIQGSTTFSDRILSTDLSAIERASKHTLVVVPTKSSLGLLSLFEVQADFAMISTGIEGEIAVLRQNHPDLPFDRLQTFEVSRTRMAFAVNPTNPVRSASIDVMRHVLSGEITNWRDLGGQSIAIKLVLVRDGGGVQTSVQSQILNGMPIHAPDAIRVQVGSQVLKIFEQEPEALGLSQLNLLLRSHAVELSTDVAIEQRLSLVTLGPPTAQMREVIGAVQKIAKTDPK
jgi:ABC-type phosphate transport system substrate-binding protein